MEADRTQDEKDREEQRKKFLRSVNVSNVKVKCSPPNCSFRTVELVLTNISQEPVREVGMGFMFLPAGTTQCPTKLATTEKNVANVLQPSERATKSFYVMNAPDDPNAKYCLTVTELRGPYLGEH